MSTLASQYLTLMDWAKRLDPDGKVPEIVEMLSQVNEILMDMLWTEGNLPTGHQCTVRTGLPSVYWRLLNRGVQPSKSTTAQITESVGMLEAWSEVDEKLANLNGNVSSFRLSEAKAFIEAMSQEMASTLFYGNSSLSPEEFNGLSVRYSSLSAGNGENIISAGGSGSDNTSIWLVVWGERSVYGIFPKGSQAGLKHEDLGVQTVENVGGNGTRLRVYQDKFNWDAGVALKDWRYVSRIANIDVSNLVSGVGAADLVENMIKATHRIHDLNAGKAAFYCNRTVFQYLDIQRRDAVQSGGQLSYDVVDGKRVMSFRGIPIRRCDALLESEATVS